MNTLLTSCCRLMSAAMNDGQVRLQTHKLCGQLVWSFWDAQIDYCPFCGTKLEDNFGLSTQTPHAAENLKTP